MIKRTLEDMNNICFNVGEAILPALESYAGVGAILVVYELKSVEVRDEDAIVAVTASDNAHVKKVLSDVLKTAAFVAASEKGEAH